MTSLAPIFSSKFTLIFLFHIRWVKSEDKPSFEMVRNLIRYEGLLAGGSCGSNVYCAVEEARKMPEGSRIVVILPDSVRNYMWFKDRLLTYYRLLKYRLPDLSPDNTQWWHQLPVSVLALDDPIIVSPTINCQKAMEIMNKRNVDQLPVVDPDGSISVKLNSTGRP
eukprot:sb/3472464/